MMTTSLHTYPCASVKTHSATCCCTQGVKLKNFDKWAKSISRNSLIWFMRCLANDFNSDLVGPGSSRGQDRANVVESKLIHWFSVYGIFLGPQDFHKLYEQFTKDCVTRMPNSIVSYHTSFFDYIFTDRVTKHWSFWLTFLWDWIWVPKYWFPRKLC